MKKFFLQIILITLTSVTASAWGWPHRLIAYTAQEHCTPATREVLDRYFDVPLDNVAVWLDQFRCAPWKPGDYSKAPNYTFKAWEHAVCVDENCYPLDHSNRQEGNGEGYGAFLRYYENLSHYKDLPDSAVVVDLKSLIHIIGDVHCPGHILYSITREVPDTMGGGIAGGYGIWQHMYKGKQRTLHALLDGVQDIHEEFGTQLEPFRAYMDTVSLEGQRRLVAGTMADYIHDAAVRSKVVYDWVTPGQDVDISFYTTPSHEQLILYLLQASAYRTAHILNTLFDPDYTGPCYTGSRDSGIGALAGIPDGAKAPGGTVIEGVLVSDCSSANMAANPQVKWNAVDVSVCRRTAYIQDNGGKRGVKIVFDSADDCNVPVFSRVRVDVSGCKVSGGNVVEGARSMEVVSGPAAVPAKHRRIAELTRADLYTYVTLDDVEFLSKEGSYTNVREFYVQPSIINSFKKPKDSDWFDESGLYVKDSDGDAIFLPVNTTAQWRRKGERLPAGTGCVSGVVVAESLPRCGNPGPLQLRISGPEAVGIGKEPASSYKVIADWNWDRNYYHSLKLESGEVTWIEDTVAEPGRVLPDSGAGFLSTSFPCKAGLSKDYNTRCAQDGWKPGEGNRECGAICYHTKMSQWAGKNAAIVVEVSTAREVGRGLSLDFTWLAGKGRNAFCPGEWKLSYSVDGGAPVDVPGVFYLRPMAWDKGDPVPAEAAVGYTENTVTLPSSLLGHEKIVLRLSPCCPFTKAELGEDCFLRIGKIVVSVLE